MLSLTALLSTVAFFVLLANGSHFVTAPVFGRYLPSSMVLAAGILLCNLAFVWLYAYSPFIDRGGTGREGGL
jgi:hypothetical protein